MSKALPQTRIDTSGARIVSDYDVLALNAGIMHHCYRNNPVLHKRLMQCLIMNVEQLPDNSMVITYQLPVTGEKHTQGVWPIYSLKEALGHFYGGGKAADEGITVAVSHPTIHKSMEVQLKLSPWLARQIMQSAEAIKAAAATGRV